MAKEQPTESSPRVAALRKAIYDLKLDEIQDLFYNVTPPPPTKLVTIKVARDPQNSNLRIIQVTQEWNALTTAEQIAWTSPSGRLEIRFSRKTTPFLGDDFEVPRKAKAFSGLPVKRITQEQVFRYTILVTTPDGFFASKEVDLKIVPAPKPAK